jgi:hypothetical protein
MVGGGEVIDITCDLILLDLLKKEEKERENALNLNHNL